VLQCGADRSGALPRHGGASSGERRRPPEEARLRAANVKYRLFGLSLPILWLSFPQLEEAFHRRKRPVWVSWRLDETYIRIKGAWRYLYRAVGKHDVQEIHKPFSPRLPGRPLLPAAPPYPRRLP
jgi:DDE domain